MGKIYSLSAHSLNGRFQLIKKLLKIYLFHLEGGLILYAALGTGQATKTDEFSENYVAIFLKTSEKSIKRSKICNMIFWIENYPPPPWKFSENSSVLVA